MPLSPGRERQEQPPSSEELAVVPVRPRRAATVPAPSAGAVACGGRERFQGQLAARAGGARPRTSATRQPRDTNQPRCRAVMKAQGDCGRWPAGLEGPDRCRLRTGHSFRNPPARERAPRHIPGTASSPGAELPRERSRADASGVGPRPLDARPPPANDTSYPTEQNCPHSDAAGAELRRERSRVRASVGGLRPLDARPPPANDTSDPTEQNCRTPDAPGAELPRERGRVRASVGGLRPLDARPPPGEHLALSSRTTANRCARR